MARITRASLRVAALATASRTKAASVPITMTFKNVAREGSGVAFDLQVSPGTATHLEIVNPFLEDYVLHAEAFLSAGTNVVDRVRISTDRPVFRFETLDREVGSVQVDLSSGHPHVLGAANGDITVR